MLPVAKLFGRGRAIHSLPAPVSHVRHGLFNLADQSGFTLAGKLANYRHDVFHHNGIHASAEDLDAIYFEVGDQPVQVTFLGDEITYRGEGLVSDSGEGVTIEAHQANTWRSVKISQSNTFIIPVRGKVIALNETLLPKQAIELTGQEWEIQMAPGSRVITFNW